MVELNTLPILWYPTMVSYVILDRESLQTGRVVGKESLDVLVPNNVGYYDPGMSSVRPAVALGIGKMQYQHPRKRNRCKQVQNEVHRAVVAHRNRARPRYQVLSKVCTPSHVKSSLHQADAKISPSHSRAVFAPITSLILLSAM